MFVDVQLNSIHRITVLDELQAFFNKQDWIFAKTYAETAPHEYILKEKTEDKEAFLRGADFIHSYDRYTD